MSQVDLLPPSLKHLNFGRFLKNGNFNSIDDIKIDQTYPRDRSSQAFVEYRNRILNQLHFGGNL